MGLILPDIAHTAAVLQQVTADPDRPEVRPEVMYL